MQSLLRKLLGILAIYAIALNTILSGMVMLASVSAAADPFNIICHSGPDGTTTTSQSPDGQPAKPGKACDHCVLCGASVSPSSTVDAIPADILEPGRLIGVLRPDQAPRRASAVATSNLARGPPLSA